MDDRNNALSGLRSAMSNTSSTAPGGNNSPGTGRVNGGPTPVRPIAPVGVEPTIRRPAPAPVVPGAPTSPAPTPTQAPTPVRMSQGADYNPNGSSTTSTSTTGSNNNQQPVDETADTQDTNTPKVSFKVIAIGGALALVLIILIVILSGLQRSTNPSDVLQEPSPSPDLIVPEDVTIPVSNYTDEEVAQLRECGYSTSEMEDYFSLGIPAIDLINDAEAQRQAWIDEAIAPLYDTASDEYKENMSSTWIGLPARSDMEDWSMEGGYYEVTSNSDYEKVDVHGDQLFIKIYTDDENHESYFFHLCTPDEWLALKDRGNVIVTYQYVTCCEGSDELGWYEDETRMFITDTSIQIIK